MRLAGLSVALVVFLFASSSLAEKPKASVAGNNRHSTAAEAQQSFHREDRARLGYTDSRGEVRDVDRKLRYDSQLGPYNVAVKVRKNTATVGGTVASSSDKELVAKIVSEAFPNLKIVNNVQVAGMSDEQLLRNIQEAFAKQGDLNINKFHVFVHQGRVTLSGDQATFRDVDKILATVLNVSGVEEIESSITVAGRPYLQASKQRKAS